jgi:ABC-2 type transport system ATP-binding protein
MAGVVPGADALAGTACDDRAVIEVRHLTKRYGSTLAVDDLSFTVRPGAVTGFLGPNGAGKTTTMRVALGLAAPTGGEVLVGGRQYRQVERPLFEVGALLDANAIETGRTAWEHMRWLARSHRIGDGRVRSLLEQVGLGGVARRRIATYSLGMRQRLGTAAALLGDPGILLFDEPVNGLDPDGVRWLRELLRSLAREGRTVFVSSHLMSEMAITADRLVVIGRGSLLADTTVMELAERRAEGVVVESRREPELARALAAAGAHVVTESDERLLVTGLDAAAVGAVAASSGIALRGLAVCHASLEEAYMELTSTSTDYRAAPVGGRDDA